jgi:hypothetical protein
VLPAPEGLFKGRVKEGKADEFRIRRLTLMLIKVLGMVSISHLIFPR